MTRPERAETTAQGDIVERLVDRPTGIWGGGRGAEKMCFDSVREVRVVRIPLDEGTRWVDTQIASGRAVVSAEERERASRFLDETDAAHHRIGRAVARSTVGKFDDVACDVVDVTAGDDGRPTASGWRLGFNIAHAGGWVVVAFSQSDDVGVDVEPGDRRVSSGGDRRLSDEILTPRERAWVQRVASGGDRGAERGASSVRRSAAMMHIWTVKEAVIKAVGAGLRIDPRDIACRMSEPGKHGGGVAGMATLHVDSEVAGPELAEADRWRVETMAVDGGYLGAVARPQEMDVEYVGFDAWREWVG